MDNPGSNNTITEMSLIYKLSSPYTVGLTISKIQMAFGTSGSFVG